MLKHLDKIAKHERQFQLLLRAMNEGRLSERDRMLQYSIGEAFQEISLFLEENKQKEAALDKLKNR